MIKSDEKEFQKYAYGTSAILEGNKDNGLGSMIDGNQDNGVGTRYTLTPEERSQITKIKIKPDEKDIRKYVSGPLVGGPLVDKEKDVSTPEDVTKLKRKLMESTYATNMQAVQDGINSKVMETGSLDDRREFMANVASANLYGKQLATKDHPYVVPDIEVDDKTNLIKLNMQEYTPPEKTKSTVLGFNTPKNKELMDDMESKHEKDAKDSLHTLNEYADEKAVSGVQNAKGKISRENITEDVKGAVRKVPTNLGTNVVESRTATASDKAVTKAIRADVKDSVSKTKQDDRIARAEAMASNVKTSEKSSEAEFV